MTPDELDLARAEHDVFVRLSPTDAKVLLDDVRVYVAGVDDTDYQLDDKGGALADLRDLDRTAEAAEWARTYGKKLLDEIDRLQRLTDLWREAVAEAAE